MGTQTSAVGMAYYRQPGDHTLLADSREAQKHGSYLGVIHFHAGDRIIEYLRLQ